jgi:hypothetical protein
VTNRIEDNDLDQVKFKLRKNKIHHLDFNPSFENTEGRRYFADVYVPNRDEDVCPIENLDIDNVDPESYPLNNLYEYIIERGFNNYMEKGSGVTCLRTGFDPGKIRLKYLELKK